ncbi:MULTISPECIES: DUF3443 domain-containing protein [Paraburkholderia]|uniref:DUF3443 domain-containing protein n=1 Tax=Paraburkholderia madseniana TaxID=2599607 RepID=A0AAP5BG47_9BURK|nr:MULTISPECIES: DUF3443 domain-containing protein [Paraburkholderia]MCX4147514.1 DUF3443 domain-containing protein [Paraburkholderia madseniana]MDN7150457.1 DUF3443 domain-containing protein [Paraburkholderia sp. WS6]MDQ6409337.1 DUF3443 domain-containing protein [Paraburkholderia madseniana]
MRTMQSHIAGKFRGWVQAVVAVMLVSVVAACGGGGGDSSSSNSSNTLNGGSLPASPTQQPIAATAANTVPITVGVGVKGVINIPTVSVTVCPPGSPPTSSSCQTINNIQVDTGSFGLRVVGSVLNASLLQALPINTVGTSSTQLAECATFADGFTWGSVRTATVAIGGETTTAGIPMQIIGDMPSSTVPAKGCGSGPADNTVSDLGANGILGIGTAPNDCGVNCENVNSSNYFACPGGSSCTPTALAPAQQVANPAANFAADNNGVIVQMPPVSNTGASSATGTLVFGIGTQSNNALAAAQTFATNVSGDMTNSVYNGTTVTAFFDSGSNAYFFADSSLAQCGSNFAGFYCPSSAQTRSITLGGLSSTRASVSIGILSASTLFGNTSNFAFNDLAGQIGGSSSFDLGLPFFYGRYMYYGFATGGQAPYVGF